MSDDDKNDAPIEWVAVDDKTDWVVKGIAFFKEIDQLFDENSAAS